MGKMAQAMMYGAITMQIRGNFDDGMRLVKEVADQAPVTIVNSINPYRLQVKTIAYEIVEALGRAPDYHCLPVGNAGNITAHWMGYTEAVANQPADQFEQVIYDAATDQFTGPKPEGLPTMVGYQGCWCCAILYVARLSENPETVATAICIGNPQTAGIMPKRLYVTPSWFDELTGCLKFLKLNVYFLCMKAFFVEPASSSIYWRCDS